MTFDPEDGSGPVTLLRDDTAPCDGGANGWQSAQGTDLVVLCGPACEAARASPSGRVRIEVGCKTRVRNTR